MTKHRNTTSGLVLMVFLLVGISGCPSPSVIPEMKDVIAKFVWGGPKGGKVEY